MLQGWFYDRGHHGCTSLASARSCGHKIDQLSAQTCQINSISVNGVYLGLLEDPLLGGMIMRMQEN